MLPGFAEAVDAAGLLGRSLRQIARLVSVGDPWDLPALTEAVESYLTVQQRTWRSRATPRC